MAEPALDNNSVGHGNDNDNCNIGYALRKRGVCSPCYCINGNTNGIYQP